MKKSLLFFLTFLAALPLMQAQDNLRLLLSPRLGAAPFALNTPVSAGSYEYKISRLEYYISEIKITHDGGQVTPMTDIYLLVRPAVDSLYDLGAHPEITNVEGITFSFGVDEAHNHADPASYPANHPLAPQNPSMHWGWAAGYRFAAIEGVAGNNFANTYEIHALGDANYKTLTLATAAENLPNGDKAIHLIADYSQVLHNLDVSAGLILHSSTGKAIGILSNLKELVFSAVTVSATTDPAFDGMFTLAPNPAPGGRAVAAMTLPEGSDYRITLTDMTGRVMLNHPVAAGSQTFAFESNLNAGVYFVHLWQNDRRVVAEKLVVAQ